MTFLGEIVNILVNLTYDHVYYVQLRSAEKYYGHGLETIKMTIKLNIFPGSDELELYVSENNGKFLILTGRQLNCR